MISNSLPKLLDTLRPSRNDLAAAVGVSRGLAEFWRQGVYQPKPDARRRLVRAVRKHAELLLKLVAAVEKEGRDHDKEPRRSKPQSSAQRFSDWSETTVKVVRRGRPVGSQSRTKRWEG